MTQKLTLTATLLLNFFLLAAVKPQMYLITDFGAKGDSITLNTNAIQSTIDKCSASGGGVVLIPKGTFLSGAIFLKKGVNLRIEKNAVLKGTAKLTDYKQIKTRWEGEDREWTSAFINVIDIDNIEISGEGTIDGSGADWPKTKNQKFSDLPKATRDSIKKNWRGRPRLIVIQNCKKIKINSLHIKNHSSWGLHVLYSSKIEIKNLNIRAQHSIPSSDGIDIDSSNGILVSGCDIDVNDDCISIKSGKDSSGLRVNRPCHDITIEHCRFGYGHGGVALGSETSGGINHVKVLNCIVDSGNWAPVRFKTQPSRGGIVENITFRNLKIISATQAFEFGMRWRMVDTMPAAKVLPIFRNIKLINISGKVKRLGVIAGLKESPITKISFKNCNLEADNGLMVKNTAKIDFSGLKATVKNGKMIISTDMPANPSDE